MKVCKICSEPKDLSEFYPHDKNGLRGECKKCTTSRVVVRDNEVVYTTPVRDFTRYQGQIYRRKYGLGNGGRGLEGILSACEEWTDMWEKQGGRCALCEVEMTPKGISPVSSHVDHCHVTGKVRKLLCNSCNTTHGTFEAISSRSGLSVAELFRRFSMYTGQHRVR